MSTSGDYAVIVNTGLVQAASLTATTAGSATTILTTNHLTRELLIANSLNADYWLTLGGVAWIPLPAGAGGAMDGIRVFIPASTVIGAYAMSGSATSGFLGLTAI